LRGCKKLSDPTVGSSLNIDLKILFLREIFFNLLAEDTGGNNPGASSWSISKLQMVLVVRKTHIFNPAKIFN
jgi:hypothetical protein